MKKTEKRSKYSKTKFLVAFVGVMGLLVLIRHGFDIDVPMPEPPIEEQGARSERQENAKDELALEESYAEMIIEEQEASNEEQGARGEEQENADEKGQGARSEEQEDTEDEGQGARGEEQEDSTVVVPTDVTPTVLPNRRIKGVWSYVQCFPDVQDVQIVAAQKNGIRPARDRKEAEKLMKRRKLVNICHSPFYTVDHLTHSIPYLVPRAYHLLNTISVNFLDSCMSKGLPPHLLMVTSVLRTTDDVSRLQRGNQNATTNSCHCYGTTVDIAYNRFVPVTGSYEGNAQLLRWNEPMKQVLAEVLNDLRLQNKCYVKYEVKQACFHLTCR